MVPRRATPAQTYLRNNNGWAGTPWTWHFGNLFFVYLPSQQPYPTVPRAPNATEGPGIMLIGARENTVTDCTFAGADTSHIFANVGVTEMHATNARLPVFRKYQTISHSPYSTRQKKNALSSRRGTKRGTLLPDTEEVAACRPPRCRPCYRMSSSADPSSQWTTQRRDAHTNNHR